VFPEVNADRRPLLPRHRPGGRRREHRDAKRNRRREAAAKRS
jgi:hypothetical protein